MMNYNIEIRKNKNIAKCRECNKAIPIGSICIFLNIYSEMNSYYSNKVTNHIFCFLINLIEQLKKIQLKNLQEEINKFSQLEKLLKLQSPIVTKSNHPDTKQKTHRGGGNKNGTKNRL